VKQLSWEHQQLMFVLPEISEKVQSEGVRVPHFIDGHHFSRDFSYSAIFSGYTIVYSQFSLSASREREENS